MPQVPISTGAKSAISFMLFMAMAVYLCMLCVVGTDENTKSSDLRRVVCGFVLVGRLQRPVHFLGFQEM